MITTDKLSAIRAVQAIAPIQPARPARNVTEGTSSLTFATMLSNAMRDGPPPKHTDSITETRGNPSTSAMSYEDGSNLDIRI